jgi:hypothetical protein
MTSSVNGNTGKRAGNLCTKIRRELNCCIRLHSHAAALLVLPCVGCNCVPGYMNSTSSSALDHTDIQLSSQTPSIAADLCCPCPVLRTCCRMHHLNGRLPN